MMTGKLKTSERRGRMSKGLKRRGFPTGISHVEQAFLTTQLESGNRRKRTTKNHDLAPELAAYALMRSFSYASHQCGRDSPTPNCHIYGAIYTGGLCS